MNRFACSFFRSQLPRAGSSLSPSSSWSPLSSSSPLLFPGSSLCLSRSLHASLHRAKIIDFLLADPGEGIAEVEILKWNVEEGQKVEEFDLIFEGASDKSAVEVKSPYNATVTKFYYQVGEMAVVGSPLLQFDVEGEEGDFESEPQQQEEPQRQEEPQQQEPQQPQQVLEPVNTGKILAIPSVRRIAKEANIDLRFVQGTGKGGRITKSDVLKVANNTTQPQQQQQRVAPAAAAAPPPPPSPSPSPSPPTPSPPPRAASIVTGEDIVQPLNSVQQAMVRSMEKAALIPRFGYSDEFEVTKLMEFRKQIVAAGEERGVKVTPFAVIVKAASMALLSFPSVNGHYTDDGEYIIKAAHNIGVAVDTPRGLLVPHIKNVEQKSIFDVATDINRLVSAGKQMKIQKDEMVGGTFTLSNIGAIGGTYASPVMLAPEIAIAALGKIQTVPKFDEEMNVKPVQIMQISFSADHRVLDGATVARFANKMKEYIENPAKMLLDAR